MIAAPTTQFWRSRPRQVRKGRGAAAFFAALTVYIIVILVAAPQAQQPPSFTGVTPATPATSAVVRDAVSGSEIDLMVGRSTVLNVGTTIARVSLTVPDIADALVTAPTQLLVHGKQPGTISLFVWDREGTIKTFEVKVRRDLSALAAHLKQLFPGEDISVIGSGKDVVVAGTVTSKYVVEKAADVAAGYVEKKENVVNMLKQQEGVASNQVMLRVRFAEVSRSAMQELGATFFAHGYKNEWIGRTAPPGVPAPEFDDGKMIFSDFLNLFVFNAKEGLGGAIRALSNKGLFQSLAEPNLIATNGKEASFLAGGEYPYPVVQSGSGTNAVTITFKEFGVRLNFTPTVLGSDLINLKVKPEVSSLDFANAVIIDGFRVPALSTRRTETEVELRDGQTFAIAGLMNNTVTSSMGKIPGIGDIPILGLLFRSKAHQKNQTELVVMITPTIIRRGQAGVSEGLPSPVEPYLGRPDKTYPNPDPYIGSARYPADQPKVNERNGAVTPRASAAPAAAPATVDTTPAPRPSAPAAVTNTPVPSRPVTQAPATTTTPAVVPQSQPAVQPARPTPSNQPAASTPAPKPAASAPQSQAKPNDAPAKDAEAVKADARAAERAMERAREQERKAAEAEAKQQEADARRQAEAARRQAAEDRAAQQKAEEDRRQAEKVAKERAKREAEIARKNAEAARKQAEEDEKREKALAEAAARLKQAQAAYQAEIDKTKGGGEKN